MISFHLSVIVLKQLKQVGSQLTSNQMSERGLTGKILRNRSVEEEIVVDKSSMSSTYKIKRII